ncbi:hypothetical protein KIPB_001912 [Kipferlia bialata]|uniref:Uncharacterized protein n=1 Tax=Kipferlia bialata TaxID=797122 RepID=A0A9K3CRA6_9EUKA|nr:hypothetical protein KIPB_001912 [Kipferlia bialata]|eukprot:g1912.t1
MSETLSSLRFSLVESGLSGGIEPFYPSISMTSQSGRLLKLAEQLQLEISSDFRDDDRRKRRFDAETGRVKAKYLKAVVERSDPSPFFAKEQEGDAERDGFVIYDTLFGADDSDRWSVFSRHVTELGGLRFHQAMSSMGVFDELPEEREKREEEARETERQAMIQRLDALAVAARSSSTVASRLSDIDINTDPETGSETGSLGRDGGTFLTQQQGEGEGDGGGDPYRNRGDTAPMVPAESSTRSMSSGVEPRPHPLRAAAALMSASPSPSPSPPPSRGETRGPLPLYPDRTIRDGEDGDGSADDPDAIARGVATRGSAYRRELAADRKEQMERAGRNVHARRMEREYSKAAGLTKGPSMVGSRGRGLTRCLSKADRKLVKQIEAEEAYDTRGDFLFREPLALSVPSPSGHGYGHMQGGAGDAEEGDAEWQAELAEKMDNAAVSATYGTSLIPNVGIKSLGMRLNRESRLQIAAVQREESIRVERERERREWDDIALIESDNTDGLFSGVEKRLSSSSAGLTVDMLKQMQRKRRDPNASRFMY